MNTSNPIFSILMPSFNQGKFLHHAIDSVLEQSFDSWELLIQDAGSTDGSHEILRNYSLLDPRIQFKIQSDLGPADALNKALARSRGIYIGCLNTDDLYLPKTLEKIHEHFSNHQKADLIYGHGYLLQNNRLSKLLSDKFTNKRFMLKIARVVHQSTFYRRSVFTTTGLKFNTDNMTCWDTELLIDAVNKKLILKRVHNFFGIMRLHGESITGSQRFQEIYLFDQKRLISKSTGKPKYWAFLSVFIRPPFAIIRRLKAKYF